MTHAARLVPTPRQGALLRSLKRWITEHGYPPSWRDLCELHGCNSTNAISGQLKALETLDFIRRNLATARAIVITPDGEAWLARNPLPAPERTSEEESP